MKDLTLQSFSEAYYIACISIQCFCRLNRTSRFERGSVCFICLLVSIDCEHWFRLLFRLPWYIVIADSMPYVVLFWFNAVICCMIMYVCIVYRTYMSLFFLWLNASSLHTDKCFYYLYLPALYINTDAISVGMWCENIVWYLFFFPFFEWSLINDCFVHYAQVMCCKHLYGQLLLCTLAGWVI